MEPRSSFPNTSVHSKAFQLYTRTFGATSSLDFWYVSYSFLNGLLTVCSNVKIRNILNYHKATLDLLQVRWKKKNIHIQISNSCLILSLKRGPQIAEQFCCLISVIHRLNMAAVTYPVDLYIYDLTKGMASQFAPMLMGSGLNLGK